MSDGPIIIYRSKNGAGETFALDPLSLRRLRQTLGDAVVPANSRVFIGHDPHFDYAQIPGTVVPQIVALLTGVSTDRLHDLGGFVFRNPSTEQEIPIKTVESRSPVAQL